MTGSIAAALIWGALIGWVVTGCTPGGTLTPRAEQALARLCATNARLQPLAAGAASAAGAVAPIAGPHGAVIGVVLTTGAALDTSLLHPQVQQACAELPPAVVQDAKP